MQEQHPNGDFPIDKMILKAVNQKKVESVSGIIKLIQTEFPIKHDQVVQHVLKLESQGKLLLTDKSLSTSRERIRHLFSNELSWYWLVTMLNVASLTSIFAIQANAFPAVYLRYIAGALFFLVLPGYSMIKALFRNIELDFAQRVAFGLACNIALVGMVALALNLTPLGVRTFSVALSLAGLTALFSTAAFVREYLGLRKDED